MKTLGCLTVGALADSPAAPRRTYLLMVLAGAMAFGQVLFALDSTFSVLTDFDIFPGEVRGRAGG